MLKWYFLFGLFGSIIGFIWGFMKGKEGEELSEALRNSFGGCMMSLFLLYSLNDTGILKKIGIRSSDEILKERNETYKKNMDGSKDFYTVVKEQEEESFEINKAKKWLWNKIIKANEYKGYRMDTKIEKTYNHVKTLNIEYTGLAGLKMEQFIFKASGITDEDESFHYEFTLEKINGNYGIFRTDSPKHFYN